MLRRLLPIVTALSALLLVCMVVQWAGWAPGPACVGLSNCVVEATPHNLVTESHTIQHGREGLWIGRCRVSFEDVLGAALGLGDVSEHRDKYERLTARMGVFDIDGLSPPLAGFGHQYGAVTYPPFGLGKVVQYELDGYLVPNWVLVAVTGLFPPVWALRRLRRCWADGPVSGTGQAKHAEPGAAADGGGMSAFWEFIAHRCPAAAELGRSEEGVVT